MVLLVIYLSLANVVMPQVSSSFGDKINHLIAYGGLMGWFGQLFLNSRHRVLLALGFVGLGIAMEYLQGMTAYRYFDWHDALANALGVAAGLAALWLGADKILVWFESRCIPSQQ